MGGAGIRQERIEQRAIIKSCGLHHIGGVHQRGYQKSRLACRGVVLVERFVDVGKDQFEGLNRPAAKPLAHRFLKARYFPLQRRADQSILGREAVDETALADPCALGDGVEREISAAGFEDDMLVIRRGPLA